MEKNSFVESKRVVAGNPLPVKCWTGSLGGLDGFKVAGHDI